MPYQATDQRGQLKLAIAHAIPNTPRLPSGPFSLIVADPPWPYHLRETDQSHRGRCPYPAMQIAEIIRLPVLHIAADDAYCFLWSTKDHLQDAFTILALWGFDYRNIFTWVKTTHNGSKPRLGIGHYGRNCTEFVLLGRRGKIPTFTDLGLTAMATAILAPVTEHSQKPEAFFAIADQLGTAIGGQRIELFARTTRPHWVSWGAEV